MLTSVNLGQLADIKRGNVDIELRVDDILVQRVSGSVKNVGKPIIIDEASTPWPGHPNTYIHVRVTREDILFPRYLYYLLTNLNNNGYFQRLATGSVQQQIRVRDVQGITLGADAG